jgi:uncharacterized protein YqgV (UPF0045/DUF77 family)
MKLRVEISLYPLNQNFLPPIDDFINRLNQHQEISILTNELSTQIYGEYDKVMQVLSSEMKISFDEPSKMVFVVKYHCPEE